MDIFQTIFKASGKGTRHKSKPVISHAFIKYLPPAVRIDLLVPFLIFLQIAVHLVRLFDRKGVSFSIRLIVDNHAVFSIVNADIRLPGISQSSSQEIQFPGEKLRRLNLIVAV